MFSLMFYLWAGERLYLDNIVLGNKRRSRSPPAGIAGCSFVQSGSLLHLSRSYFGCAPQKCLANGPLPLRRILHAKHWSCWMSDLHSWFHIRFIKGGILEALFRIKDDDERKSFFLIVLEKVNNQGLTGPHVFVCRGLLCGFQYATRLHGRDLLW